MSAPGEAKARRARRRAIPQVAYERSLAPCNSAMEANG